MRPGLIFKRAAATEIRRLFLGPLFPGALVRRSLLKLVPDTERLRFQAVHSDDVGDAYRRAVLADDARGAFNIAADPVIDPAVLADVLGARPVPVSPRVLRAAAAATWALRLQPAPPGWIDLALSVPIMDCSRARAELGWAPAKTATEALTELLAGLRDGADHPTPPLDRRSSGALRWRELATGVGKR
jgi:UDP-glucose 4-epimerase